MYVINDVRYPFFLAHPVQPRYEQTQGDTKIIF